MTKVSIGDVSYLEEAIPLKELLLSIVPVIEVRVINHSQY